MSQWTHVSGCIRIDGLPQVLGLRAPQHDYAAVLGTPSSNDWRPGEPYRQAKDIPAGSEGSIQYAVTDAGEGLVWKTVAVWGDLRDFDAEDCASIDAWFARIVASPLVLREAHLVVDVEDQLRYLLIADGKEVRRVDLVQKPAAGGVDAPGSEVHRLKTALAEMAMFCDRYERKRPAEDVLHALTVTVPRRCLEALNAS